MLYDYKVMSEKSVSSAKCPVYRIIEKVCKKWSLHLLRALSENKHMRFSDFQQAIPDINTRMLSERLSELEQEGLITKKAMDGKPNTVEYVITEKGADLRKVFKALCDWTKKWEE